MIGALITHFTHDQFAMAIGPFILLILAVLGAWLRGFIPQSGASVPAA